jgi:nicotinamide-nucleotide amidase
VACAESVTGGALCAALIDVAGASAVVRGGVIAYHPDLKTSLLGVTVQTLHTAGIVSERTAIEMARGVREQLAASFGLATTGVAGPDWHDGVAPGRVCVAVVGPCAEVAVTIDVVGDRAEVRSAAVGAALDALQSLLDAPQAGAEVLGTTLG